MEKSSAFLRSQGDFQKDCFLKDGLAKYDVKCRVIICGVTVQFSIS